ncbi:MAG: hypothetical protein R3C52_04480 [Hyphomonadaceae bacterium]
MAVLIAGHLALGAAPSASAQVDTALTDRLSNIAVACSNAFSDKTQTPQMIAATCTKVLADMDTEWGKQATVNQHETNIRLFYQGMVYSIIGAQYTKIDGSRTQRVCDCVERQWSAFAKLDLAASPKYESQFQKVRDGARTTVRFCRSERGAPTGATPL